MADIRNNAWEWLHYDNPDFQIQYRRNYMPANVMISDMTIHWHDDVEFIYVTEGSAGYYINDEKIIIHAHEGLFVNSRQRHLIESTEEDCVLYCLIFHPIILCSSEYIAYSYVMPILENREIPYVLLKENEPWQKRVLQAIADMYPVASSEKGHLQLMKNVFDLWDELYQNLITCSEDKNMKENMDMGPMKKMVAYIHKNYTNNIKLPDICSAGGVGKTKCSQLFAAHYNLTPMEYLRNYRIDKAAKMLEITDLSITDIAYETGFSDASYFANVFHRQIGCSPQKYRSYGKGLSRYYEQIRYPNIYSGL